MHFPFGGISTESLEAAGYTVTVRDRPEGTAGYEDIQSRWPILKLPHVRGDLPATVKHPDDALDVVSVDWRGVAIGNAGETLLVLVEGVTGTIDASAADLSRIVPGSVAALRTDQGDRDPDGFRVRFVAPSMKAYARCHVRAQMLTLQWWTYAIDGDVTPQIEIESAVRAFESEVAQIAGETDFWPDLVADLEDIGPTTMVIWDMLVGRAGLPER